MSSIFGLQLFLQILDFHFPDRSLFEMFSRGRVMTLMKKL